MIPSARKLIAVPEMIWSTLQMDRPDRVDRRERHARRAQRVDEPDDPRPLPAHECAQIAPQMPKNAPVSSIPSSATLITPLRSQ